MSSPAEAITIPHVYEESYWRSGATTLPEFERPKMGTLKVRRELVQPAARTLAKYFRTAVDLSASPSDQTDGQLVAVPELQPDTLSDGTLVLYDVERYANTYDDSWKTHLSVLSHNASTAQFEINSSFASFLLHKPQEDKKETFTTTRTLTVKDCSPERDAQEYVRSAGVGIIMTVKGAHRLVAPSYLYKNPQGQVHGSYGWEAVGPLGRAPVGQTSVLEAQKDIKRYERIKDLWVFLPSIADLAIYAESMPKPPSAWQQLGWAIGYWYAPMPPQEP